MLILSWLGKGNLHKCMHMFLIQHSIEANIQKRACILQTYFTECFEGNNSFEIQVKKKNKTAFSSVLQHHGEKWNTIQDSPEQKQFITVGENTEQQCQVLLTGTLSKWGESVHHLQVTQALLHKTVSDKQAKGNISSH